MKQLFASAGLLALGATALHAYDPEMTRQVSGRPWTVAAAVRGFYDDNINTSPDRIIVPIYDTSGTLIGRRVLHPREDSFGVEVSPSVHVNLPLERTFIALGYIYSLKWYEDRNPHSIDQAHEFNGKLRHQFSPRHDIGVDDSFVLTSEPTVADRFGIITAPTKLRTRSDVLHNRGSIEDNIGLTRQFSLSLGYMNNWYDYEEEGPGSRSALLDRIEHLIRLDARYLFNPKVVGLVGYSFGINSFTGDDVISPAFGSHPALMSNDRDSYSHYGYVGADVDLTSQLRASVRVGGQFVDYHNSGESSASPYADASLSYVYLPGDSIEVGVRHARNATDVSTVDNKGRPTLDAETTVVYGQLTHKITSKLTGSVLGQFQTSSFNNGLQDGNGEDLYLVGVNFEYHFNRHFSAEAGYNYDLLSSDIRDRGYDRNRAYVGVRVSY